MLLLVRPEVSPARPCGSRGIGEIFLVSNPSSQSSGSAFADGDDTAKSLYRRFLEVRENVLRHKWLKSEEAGNDIGFEAALVDWVRTTEAETKETPSS